MTPRRRPAHPSSPLPRPRLGWYALLGLAAAAVGLALYAYSQQLRHGDIVSGLRDPGRGGAAWGLYIVSYVYFVGVSFAGISVASMARLFHIDVLKPLTRIAELLTIVALIAGALMVLADLGRPIHGLLDLPRLARPSSPFFGTFTLVVSGYLFSSVVYFFVSGRRDAARLLRTGPAALRPLYWLWASGYRGSDAEHARHGRTSFWLALTILPLLVVAHSTLGFIFGIQSGRPGWYSALQAPSFVVMAGVSGTGALIVVAMALRRLLRLQLPDAGITWLGNLLWMLAIIYLYLMVVEELTATYAAPLMDRHVAHEIVTGRFALSFWVAVGCLFLAFLIPFLLFLLKRASPAWVVLAAVLANVGAVLKRLLIVVPSQTHGTFLPITPGDYSPTWIEWAVAGGAAALVVLPMLLFGRIFPLVPGAQPPLSRSGPTPREPLRRLITMAWAALSVTLLVVGLSDSFRLWSGQELDPRIPFSPVIFATGVIMLFATAVVYEVIPGARRRSAAGRLVDRARLRLMRAPHAGRATPIRATERRSAPHDPAAPDHHPGGSHE